MEMQSPQSGSSDQPGKRAMGSIVCSQGIYPIEVTGQGNGFRATLVSSGKDMQTSDTVAEAQLKAEVERAFGEGNTVEQAISRLKIYIGRTLRPDRYGPQE